MLTNDGYTICLSATSWSSRNLLAHSPCTSSLNTPTRDSSNWPKRTSNEPVLTLTNLHRYMQIHMLEDKFMIIHVCICECFAYKSKINQAVLVYISMGINFTTSNHRTAGSFKLAHHPAGCCLLAPPFLDFSSTFPFVGGSTGWRFMTNYQQH